VLVAAVALGVVGVWGMIRLLGRCALDPLERLTLALALFPAMIGLAAFGGLLAGWPGPLLPAIVAAVLALLGVVLRPSPVAGAARDAPTVGVGQAPPSLAPPESLTPTLSHEHGAPTPRQRERASSSSCLLPTARCLLLYGAGALGTTLLTPLSGGALRIGDWVAHWFLVLVYLGQPLPDLRTFTNRVGDFGVIARPPLYNLEGGVLVGALGIQFWPFQLVTPLLALTVAAAAVLWARNVGGAGAVRIMVPLVGMSPFLLQNASYPWPKMVAAGLVLVFLALIRAAALARDPGRARQAFVLAALCAGLGYLAHQTTVFYVGPTILWLLWRRPRPLLGRPAGWVASTWVLAGIVGVLAFAPWQGWVLATYGLRATVEANPAWFGADVSDTLADWLLKGTVAGLGTLVPLPLLGAILHGMAPSLDQALRVQLALLTGALGVSGCWLLCRAAWRAVTGKPALTPRPPLPQAGEGEPTLTPALSQREREQHPQLPTADRRLPTRLLRRPPWLALVVLGGFFGQVMLQPNWHDTGDAAESMTPIVVLGLAYVARETGRLGPAARRLFFGLVLAELAVYLVLWLTWAFSSAWTRDPNAVLASRYGLDHIRGLWGPAVLIGGVLLASGLSASAVLLWRALTDPGLGRAQAGSAASTGEESAVPAS